MIRLGSKKEHDPAILKASSSSKHGRSANHEMKSKKACSSPASIIMKKLVSFKYSTYYIILAWRNSFDPAPKIGLLIAEVEEGRNLSKCCDSSSKVLPYVSIRYDAKVPKMLHFLLLAAVRSCFSPPSFYCRLGSASMITRLLLVKVVDATLTANSQNGAPGKDNLAAFAMSGKYYIKVQLSLNQH